MKNVLTNIRRAVLESSKYNYPVSHTIQGQRNESEDKIKRFEHYGWNVFFFISTIRDHDSHCPHPPPSHWSPHNHFHITSKLIVLLLHKIRHLT
jgi:hypothetical protein